MVWKSESVWNRYNYIWWKRYVFNGVVLIFSIIFESQMKKKKNRWNVSLFRSIPLYRSGKWLLILLAWVNIDIFWFFKTRITFDFLAKYELWLRWEGHNTVLSAYMWDVCSNSAFTRNYCDFVFCKKKGKGFKHHKHWIILLSLCTSNQWFRLRFMLFRVSGSVVNSFRSEIFRVFLIETGIQQNAHVSCLLFMLSFEYNVANPFIVETWPE